MYEPVTVNYQNNQSSLSCCIGSKLEGALSTQRPITSIYITVMNERGVLLHYFPNSAPASNLKVLSP